jgi:hypothetical protein
VKNDLEKPPRAPDGHTVHIHASKRALTIVVALILAPWFVAGGLLLARKKAAAPHASVPAHLAPEGPRMRQAQPGPWGDIQLVRIAVEPPEEFIFVNETQEPPNWVFPRWTAAQVEELIKSIPLTPEQRAALHDKARWETDPAGVRLRPEAELVLGLDPSARERLYNVLALSAENRPQNTAFSFNPRFLGERLEQSGLTQASIDLFQRLLYRRGDLLLFADMNLVLPRLPDDHERVRFVKTLSRKTTLLAKLRVNPDTDVDKLVAYWGFDGRSKDLRPLLESLRRVPGGAVLDLAHLLPPFARRRIYTYPVPSNDPLAGRRDCHWSSLNFFGEIPDDRFTDQEVAVQTIAANYYQISSGTRLGDLVLLMTRDEKVVHSAVYVADDVVFTKNGPMYTQPWMLQRVDDLLEYYSAFYPANERLRVRFYRQKELAPVQRAAQP